MNFRVLAPVALVVSAAASAQTPVNLATWNFNDSNLTVDSGTAPSSSFAAIGGVAQSYATGNALGLTPAGQGVQLVTFPTQGQNPLTAGVRANASTVGLSQILSNRIRLNFDLRATNTASRYFQVQYTTDGSAWINIGGVTDWGTTGGSTFKTFRATSFTNDGASYVITDAAAYNNANFGVRVVTAFAPSTSTYAAVSGTYAASGTYRFDNFTLEAVPEPASMAVLGLGLAALRRRRAKK